jgi:tetratricopeptide (TPR) repeat protein
VQDHIATISKGSKAPQLIATAAILVAAVFAWFAIRWQIGDLVVDAVSVSSPDSAEIAETAKGLTPSSPRPYWLSGAILKTSFDDPTFDGAIRQYEEAARRAPYHYRSWTELGRINEQAGRYEIADAAFRRAIELAPDYTIPHWQTGNFYLRRGRVADAVSELNAAAKHSSPYRLQVFSTAWNVLGQDTQQVEKFLTDRADSKATLALFYGNVNRSDDAVRVWNLIDPEEKSQYESLGKVIANDLLVRRSYRGSLEFSRQSGIDPDARPDAITNGGFELPIRAGERDVRFDWSLLRVDGRIDASTDNSVSHGGKRSLKLTFRGYGKPTFPTIRQAIALSPGSHYRLTFWVRTENLRGGSLPLLELRSAKDDAMLASSPAFESGSSDWREVNLEFRLPDNSDGAYLISGRESCADECPMNGIFWLDDFSLVRLN